MLTGHELADGAKRCCQDAAELPNRPRALLRALCDDPRVHRGMHRDAVRLIRRALEVNMDIAANRKGGVPAALGLSSRGLEYKKTTTLGIVIMMNRLLEHSEWVDADDKKLAAKEWDYVRDPSGAIRLWPFRESEKVLAARNRKRAAVLQLLKCRRKLTPLSEEDLALGDAFTAVFRAILSEKDWATLEKEAALLGAPGSEKDLAAREKERAAISKLVKRWRKRATLSKKDRAAVARERAALADRVRFPYRTKRGAAEAVVLGFRAAKIPGCERLTVANALKIYTLHRDLTLAQKP